ncbi:MAG: peptide-methionine (S)-S-oxide reductase MsrA [Sphingosinicella sp.]
MRDLSSHRILPAILILALAVLLAWLGAPAPNAAAQPRQPGTVTAIFAGGCFWCTEADFDHVPGVVSTVSGYSGGRVTNPTYQQVSEGNTGHIEVVLVRYDPTRVTYATLVDRFFPTIDPLDGGGQFCDRGEQYRSVIFVADANERRVAEAALGRVQRRLGQPVATLILPRQVFYRAEDYHQDYYRRNPVRYRFYRWNCGRDARLRAVWRQR